MCARKRNLIGFFFLSARIFSELYRERCKIHGAAVAKSTLAERTREENSRQMDARKRKIFRVASGQSFAPADGRFGKRESAAESNERKTLKKKKGRRRERDGKSTKVGRNCYGSGFTRSPVDRMPSKGWNTFLSLRKSVILPCVTRITRGELFARARKRVLYRDDVNVIFRLRLVAILRLSRWRVHRER